MVNTIIKTEPSGDKVTLLSILDLDVSSSSVGPGKIPAGWYGAFAIMGTSYIMTELMAYLTEPLFNKKTRSICDTKEDAESLFANIYVVCNLSSLIAVPAISWLSDRVGAKPMLLVAFAMRVLSVWIFTWATTAKMIYLYSIVRGVGMSVTTLFVGLIGNILDPELRTRYIAWLFAISNVGVGIAGFGPSISAALGLSLETLATFAGLFAAAVLACVKDPKSCDTDVSSPTTSPESGKGPNLICYVTIAMVFFRFAFNVEVTTKQNVLEHHYEDVYCFDGQKSTEQHQENYGWLYLSQQMARAASGILVGWLVTGGEFPIAIGTVSTMGVALLIAAFPIGWFTSSALIVLAYALVGASNPMFYSITSQLAGKSQGKVLAVLSFCKDLASVAAPKVAMYIWSLGADARQQSQAWATVLPACIGTVSALTAATFLMVAWCRKKKAQ